MKQIHIRSTRMDYVVEQARERCTGGARFPTSVTERQRGIRDSWMGGEWEKGQICLAVGTGGRSVANHVSIHNESGAAAEPPVDRPAYTKLKEDKPFRGLRGPARVLLTSILASRGACPFLSLAISRRLARVNPLTTANAELRQAIGASPPVPAYQKPASVSAGEENNRSSFCRIFNWSNLRPPALSRPLALPSYYAPSLLHAPYLLDLFSISSPSRSFTFTITVPEARGLLTAVVPHILFVHIRHIHTHFNRPVFTRHRQSFTQTAVDLLCYFCPGLL